MTYTRECYECKCVRIFDHNTVYLQAYCQDDSRVGCAGDICILPLHSACGQTPLLRYRSDPPHQSKICRKQCYSRQATSQGPDLLLFTKTIMSDKLSNKVQENPFTEKSFHFGLEHLKLTVVCVLEKKTGLLINLDK